MTNYEKYKYEIEKIISSGDSFGVSSRYGNPISCHDGSVVMNCGQCKILSSGEYCHKTRGEWLNAEAKNIQTINWQKVPVNTPVEVTNNLKSWDDAIVGHFKVFHPNSEFPFIVFNDGKTSFTGPDTGVAYRRARIILDEDLEKYASI